MLGSGSAVSQNGRVVESPPLSIRVETPPTLRLVRDSGDINEEVLRELVTPQTNSRDVVPQGKILRFVKLLPSPVPLPRVELSEDGQVLPKTMMKKTSDWASDMSLRFVSEAGNFWPGTILTIPFSSFFGQPWAFVLSIPNAVDAYKTFQENLRYRGMKDAVVETAKVLCFPFCSLRRAAGIRHIISLARDGKPFPVEDKLFHSGRYALRWPWQERPEE